ncbi:MAG TPA: thiamine pyrophosphate-dependent enzyme [Stellaceae bacterium]|nr:thiamine pyrophosphate-dependent enzyme [Stellaceae bacterium]
MNADVLVAASAAKQFRTAVKPIWCPGCGDFGVLAAIERAFAVMAMPPEQIALISGIGCSSRLPAYLTPYGFHGVHGRALPFATGLKLARPDLEVIVVGGDGDGYSIGGNHFLHACRRNTDITYIVMDNRVFGMTKGQPSPTTEPDWDSPMAPGGPDMPSFDPVAIALAAGANFIARGFSGDPNRLAEMIVEAVRWPGFALVEVLSPCVTFRPDETEWKHAIHPGAGFPFDDRSRAAAAAARDPFATGIVFRSASRPRSRRASPVASGDLVAVEKEFAV